MRPSKIHGVGAFALRNIKRGEHIEDPARDPKFRGYNHSCTPNVVLGRVDFTKYGTNVLAFAMRDIKEGEELTVWYGGPRLLDQKICTCPQCV